MDEDVNKLKERIAELEKALRDVMYRLQDIRSDADMQVDLAEEVLHKRGGK